MILGTTKTSQEYTHHLYACMLMEWLERKADTETTLAIELVDERGVQWPH